MIVKCQKCGFQWEMRSQRSQRCANPACRCRKWDNYAPRTATITATEESLLDSPTIGRLLILMHVSASYQKNYAVMLDLSQASLAPSIRALQQFRVIKEEPKRGRIILHLDNDRLIKIILPLLKARIKSKYDAEIRRLREARTVERFDTRGIIVPASELNTRFKQAKQKLDNEREVFEQRMTEKLASPAFGNFVCEYYWSHSHKLGIPFIEVIKEYLLGVRYL